MSISENETQTQAVTTTTTTRQIKPAKSKKPAKPERTPAQMTFFEHLAELRNRIVWCVLAVVVCGVVGWFFSTDLINAFRDLARPAIDDLNKQGYNTVNFANFTYVASFAITFEVAIYAGLLLASPIIIYHILAFLAPALEPELTPTDAGYKEEVKMLSGIKRSVIFFIPVVAIFFITGIAFAYYLIIPQALKFLLEFGKDQAPTLLELKPFIDSMTKIMFWTGLVFELPIFLFLLAKIKFVTWRKLASWWKYALIASLVIAAFITPSPEILSQMIIAVPVFGLFWLGVLFARFA